MTKKTKTPIAIFAESTGLYFSNFDRFVKYMTFPVLGQIAGLILIFALTYLYNQNLPFLIEKYSAFNNFSTIIITSVIVAFPGLVLFTKAFWEYLVAYGAVNSMLDNMLKSGRVYDFSAHTELIKRRTPAFIGLWLIIGIISLLAICPFFTIICGIFGVYFVLVFQVFTFESDVSPAGCLKRSLQLVKGHFSSTFLLIALVGALTYIFIPQIFIKLGEYVGINNFVAQLINPLFAQIPDFDLTQFGGSVITSKDISLMAFEVLVAQIFICYTLPLRSILCTMWYRELGGNKSLDDKPEKKKSRRTSKRPSEKLMEASHKKYSKTKIDSNILRRAMEKDDED